MRASYVTALALLLLIAGRWAHGQSPFDVQTIAGGIFVILVIAALDHGRTEAIAKGIAWILLAVVALSKNSPVTAIARLINTKLTTSTTSTGPGGVAPVQ